MLYCLAVEEDPSTDDVECWGRGPGDWASGERTALFSYGESEGHTPARLHSFPGTPFIQARSSGSASIREASYSSRRSGATRCDRALLHSRRGRAFQDSAGAHLEPDRFEGVDAMAAEGSI